MSLQSHNLSYGYTSRGGAPSFGLHDVSMTIARGSLVGLLGPNGCGKTTLLKVLCGLLRPERGTVTLDGRDVAALSRREIARHIAVVPQETHPAFDYSAIEMVLMGRHPHLGTFQVEGPADLTIALDAMTATGTAHLASRPYMTLSGGEKQRVVIASALAQASDILLLDEPTASLDLRYQLEIASLLGRLNREPFDSLSLAQGQPFDSPSLAQGKRGVTMVLATHDLNLAASLCDTLVVLRDGRVLAQGPTRDVLTGSTIAHLYDVEADVQFHERAGHLTVVPVRRLP